MSLRIDPRVVDSLKAELQVSRDRIAALPKGSQQRISAEDHLKQLEEQFKRINAGYMGTPQ